MLIVTVSYRHFLSPKAAIYPPNEGVHYSPRNFLRDRYKPFSCETHKKVETVASKTLFFLEGPFHTFCARKELPFGAPMGDILGKPSDVDHVNPLLAYQYAYS
jgi:hypothetical protein